MDDIDFIVGTFGTAFASYGAFVVCDEMFPGFLGEHAAQFDFHHGIASGKRGMDSFYP